MPRHSGAYSQLLCILPYLLYKDMEGAPTPHTQPGFPHTQVFTMILTQPKQHLLPQAHTLPGCHYLGTTSDRRAEWDQTGIPGQEPSQGLPPQGGSMWKEFLIMEGRFCRNGVSTTHHWRDSGCTPQAFSLPPYCHLPTRTHIHCTRSHLDVVGLAPYCTWILLSNNLPSACLFCSCGTPRTPS